VIAVTRKAYEQLGLFNPAMLPGRLNMVEISLRYQNRYGYKSAALPGWDNWQGRSFPENNERNAKYIEKVYGVRVHDI
jgi:hypothetical protein